MNYNWKLSDLNSISKNNKTVFSCFSCGGGSTMGYKLSGYEVIGNLEIDKKIYNMYIKNHTPKYGYNMDIRKFNSIPNHQLPEELLNLDILDGSPPCSVFSLSGSREKAWNKKKKFKEGQKAQKLDDLFLYFIDTVDKLKPKIFIAENVKGLIQGNAKGYVNEIIKKIKGIGYTCSIYLLNSAFMGVPQRRERIFFIGHKNELNYTKLQLNFNESPIYFKEIREKCGVPLGANTKYGEMLKYARPTDRKISDISQRLFNKNSGFNHQIVNDNIICPTITSNGMFFRYADRNKFTKRDLILAQSFPNDYDFNGNDVQYVCGMSVPPFMMKGIAGEVYRQWLK